MSIHKEISGTICSAFRRICCSAYNGEKAGEGSVEERFGRWLRVHWHLGDPVLWAGPGWAMLCGAIGAGAGRLDREMAIRLLLAYFLADPLQGAVWHGAATLAAANDGDGAAAAEATEPSSWLPYARPGSASTRLQVRWQQIVRSLRHDGALGTALGGVTWGLLLSVLVGLLLGGHIWPLTVGALALALCGLVAGAGIPTQWRVLFPVWFAWLLGHAALSPLRWLPVAIGGLYAMTLYAYATLSDPALGRSRLSLANAAQIGVVLLLILARQPWLAGIVGALLWAQWLLQWPLGREGRVTAFWRWCNVPLLTSMLAAAWGIAAIS